jgi:hypothetical protein
VNRDGFGRGYLDLSVNESIQIDFVHLFYRQKHPGTYAMVE